MLASRWLVAIAGLLERSEVKRVGSRVPGPADGSGARMAFGRLEPSDEVVGGGGGEWPAPTG